MGAEDLIDNGHDVAVIDYHSGDVYETTSGLARLQYYGLQGSPTAWFDGGNASVGGNHTTSLYTTYLPKVNQRIAIPSDFTMSVEGSNSGLIDYELVIEIENVGGGATSNLALHVAVTESDIQQSWQGMTELNFTQRLNAPNQFGTALDFSSGDVVEETVSFTFNPDWVAEHCEVVMFVQNTQTKEVLQAIKADITDFGTSNVNDAALKQVAAPQSICINSVSPKIEIANYGLDNLTSVDIYYDVNGEPEMTYSWTGNLATYETEVIELDAFTFTLLEDNVLSVNCDNPNGQVDEFPGNNSKEVDMAEAINVPSPITLVLKLDDFPEQTSWEILSSDDDVLYSGGSYTTPNQFIAEEFILEDIDCYRFIIYDEGGDGLTGAGTYKLAYEGPTIFAEGKEFGYEDQVQFGVGLTGVDPIEAGVKFDVFPNPVKDDARLVFTLEQADQVQVSVFNSIGEQVFQSEKSSYQAGEHQFVVPSGTFNTGIYFIRLDAGSSYTKKIIVN